MEHSYFKDRISAFIDGELPPYEEQVVREHLSDCEECQKLKADLERLDTLIEEKSGLNDDAYWEEWKGSFDMLRIYNTALTEPEIQAIYNSEKP